MDDSRDHMTKSPAQGLLDDEMEHPWKVQTTRNCLKEGNHLLRIRIRWLLSGYVVTWSSLTFGRLIS